VKVNTMLFTGYGELVASLQRLQLQLKKNGLSQGPGGYTSLEGQIAAVQTLLLSPEFGRALAVHNKVQEVWNQWHTQPSGGSRQPATAPSPVSTHAQTLVRDVSLFAVSSFSVHNM
jgi:MAGUK p55 subfamily protein 5